MNLPKFIKIGGHQYKVIFPYVFTERFDRVADIDYSKKIIRISKDCANEPRAETSIVVSLIHEILHGINNRSGGIIFPGDDEEKIDILAEGIHQVLVDNPKLWHIGL